MTTPATRTLAVVLRESLAAGPGVRLMVCQDAAGRVAYVLAFRGRLLYLGTAAGATDLVMEGEPVPAVPRVGGAATARGAGQCNYSTASPLSDITVVPHGLGVVPAACVVTWRTGGTAAGSQAPVVTSKTASAFNVQFVASAAQTPGATVLFDWIAHV